VRNAPVQDVCDLGHRLILAIDRLLPCLVTRRIRPRQLGGITARSCLPTAVAAGQLNAVRAAFKAGVTPARIARQFGLSHSDVRKALASEASEQGSVE
jgi:hypothetical protein